VWVAAGDDPRGSLARTFTAEELREATEVFAVASHVPIDAERVLARITTEPIGAGKAVVSLSAPSAPQQVRAGEPFVAEVTLRNDGPVSLTSFVPNPIRFAYVWSNVDAIDDTEQAFATALGRSRIEPGSKRGSTRRYEIAVDAPRERGPHVLRVSQLQEMVQWFDVEVQLTIDVV